MGEALIDFVGGRDDEGKNLFYYYNGGSSLNAAVASARLETPTLYIGKLSQDMFGKQMQAYFEANNVELVPWLCDVKENSTIGFAKLDAGGSASYVFYTDGTSVTQLSADEILKVFNTYPIEYLLTGSVALALEEAGNHILEAIKRVGPSRFNLILDPNVRPTVIADFEKYLQRIYQLVEISYLVKLSDEDLLYLFPNKTLDEGIKALLDLGAEEVVLTKGKDGLEWRNNRGKCGCSAVDNCCWYHRGGDTVSGAIMTFLKENKIGRGVIITAEQATSPHLCSMPRVPLRARG